MVSSHSVPVVDRRSLPVADGSVAAVDARMATLGATFVFCAVALPGAVMRPFPDMLSVATVAGLGLVLVILTVVDLLTLRLPNALTLLLVVTGLAASLRSPMLWLDSVAGAALGFGLLWSVAAGYRWARGQAGLGLGDAKLMAAAGAWLGAEAIPPVLLVASLLGLGWALLAQLSSAELTARSKLAFGPFIAMGFWLVLIYGTWFGELIDRW